MRDWPRILAQSVEIVGVSRLYPFACTVVARGPTFPRAQGPALHTSRREQVQKSRICERLVHLLRDVCVTLSPLRIRVT